MAPSTDPEQGKKVGERVERPRGPRLSGEQRVQKEEREHRHELLTERVDLHDARGRQRRDGDEGGGERGGERRARQASPEGVGAEHDAHEAR